MRQNYAVIYKVFVVNARVYLEEKDYHTVKLFSSVYSSIYWFNLDLLYLP